MKGSFKNKSFIKSILSGVIFLILAGIISSLAFSYADAREGQYLNDLILDNIPTIHLTFLTLLLPAFAVFLVLLSLAKYPNKIPFSLKSISLLYIIRAFFITLTNLKARPEKIILTKEYGLYNLFPYQGNDLFFSGHVSFPVLAALIFWENKNLRTLFMATAVLSGVAMLFAKAHYSIDIFAAPFMAYAIFKLSEKLFKKDFNYAQT